MKLVKNVIYIIILLLLLSSCENNKLIFETNFEEIGIFSEEMLPVKIDKAGYANKYGDLIIDLKYDDTYAFSCGLGAVKLNNKFGYINRNGYEAIPIVYDLVSYFINDITYVKQDEEYYFINKDGTRVGMIHFNL